MTSIVEINLKNAVILHACRKKWEELAFVTNRAMTR
jgi:hypothetical protein